VKDAGREARELRDALNMLKQILKRSENLAEKLEKHRKLINRVIRYTR